ncbi:partial Gingipain R2, partial [uncultured bacterium]
EGKKYHRVNISSLLQRNKPGDPQVPMCGALLGLPSTKGVSVQILDAGYETLSGYRLYPAPDLSVTGDSVVSLRTKDLMQVFILNQKVYSTDSFYPGTIVETGYTGFMRDQPVAQVQFYPVQYHPVTHEIRLYRRILARITWNTPVSIEKTIRLPSPAYEPLLRGNILNYDILERPPVAKDISLPESAETKNDSIASDGTHLKIGISENGIYKLTYDDLTNAGLKLNSIDPRTLRMSNKGAEVPISIYGESDGVFDTNDSILFYGIANNDIYTSKNVYWLTAGDSNGQRMSTVDGALSGNTAIPDYFPATLHAEEDSYYWQTIPNGVGEDHWFWDDKLTAPKSRDFFLILNHISTTAGTAAVHVRLKGRTDVQTNPDHHTKIYLNSIEIDDQSWDGQSIYDHEITVLHSYLNEGTNTVRVEAVGDTGAAVDQVFVDWIDIDYFDTYVAENDELLFGVPADGTFQFEVAGFGSNDVEVFDVTDHANVTRIMNTGVFPGSGKYTLQFEDDAQAGTRYLALTSARYKSPASIESDEPSSWKSISNGADYIIITHEDFYDSALKLANHRSDSGLRVATVKVTDIYDEFNDGIFNPKAIRDFLSYSYNNWVAPAPTYVLLHGDACQDYKDNLKTGTMDYVPSQLIETDILGETPSDNWFVLVSGDDILPDMFIGRLSAETKTQANDIVDKIISYEKNPPDDSWNKDVLFVADDDDASFEEMSEELVSLLPDDYVTNKVYVSNYTSGDPTKDIINYINKGSLLANYTGHGAVDRWGLWENNTKVIFDNNDIKSSNNTHKLTMMTVADCLNGFFTGTKPQVSIAEEFQRLADKGAIAVWAPTALSYTPYHRILMQEFYASIFQDGLYGLGAATTAAKIATYAQGDFLGELVETFVLFGDPATELGVSADASLSVIAPNGGEILAAGSAYTIRWTAPQDMMKFTLKYSLNNGNSWKKIAKNAEGTSYEWKIPVLKKDKKKCLIRVIGYDEFGKKRSKDTSDATFTIETVR